MEAEQKHWKVRKILPEREGGDSQTLSKPELEEIFNHYTNIITDTHLLIEYAASKGRDVSIRDAFEGLTKEMAKIANEIKEMR